MTVRAILRDGTEATLAPKHGSTINEALASLTKDVLTGSAVPLADAEVELDDGRKVPYTDINSFAEDQTF